MLPATEIIGGNKNLASTKKSLVDKILASTKFSPQQNVGAGAEESPYCLAQQSPQQLTSPKPRWWSPTSPRRCWFPRMQSPSVTLPLTLLLWADCLQYRTGLLYRPAMQKTSKFLAPTKYRRPPKFHWFSPNYSSLYIYKLVKTKSDHHHCPLSVYALTTSKIDAIIEIHWWSLFTLQMVGGGEERGRGMLVSLSRWIGWGGGGVWANNPSVLVSTSCHNFSFGLSFAYLQAAVRPLSINIGSRWSENRYQRHQGKML